MQIPETPSSIEQLDLMKRLEAYTEGQATWKPDNSPVGLKERQACQALRTNLVELVNKVIAPLLDRITAREMDMFTMHDRTHGLKVAHLMWHILVPDRQKHLTPPEIGLMVAAAHIHDLGMALTNEERAKRLDPSSDLWDRLELQESQKAAIERLREQTIDPKLSDTARAFARYQLAQAEEALLCQDTRDRHATRERYIEVLNKLKEFHEKDSVRIPDIEAGLSFDGDSFYNKLIDICESHRGDADILVQNDPHNPERPRYPRDYPVGSTNADLHMVAAALRLADTLDFDRERTPAVLYHYLLPGTLSVEHKSVLEWDKHLTISNWHIEPDAIVFRGRCTSHIIHHTVVQFCSIIEEEITTTRATFGALNQEVTWDFILPPSVKPDIHEEGYKYVPYRFELDDERVYSLLMGGAIYGNPLVAVRELVQNAVDACKLRDALTQLYEPHVQPSTTGRIIVRYEESTEQFPQPRLIVKDTGTGMDAWLIDRYFLKVGRSYYNSSDFNQTRVDLRRRALDFAPVSEFGIGFLSVFLLADHAEIETAMWEPIRGDSTKRKLHIDGPTRLIRLDEQRNQGPGRFKGTQITLYLCRGSQGNKNDPPIWEEIREYLADVCQDLPYRLELEHVSTGEQVTVDWIDPKPLITSLPPELEPLAFRIPLADKEIGLEGEIVLFNMYLAHKIEEQMYSKSMISITETRDVPDVFFNARVDTLLGQRVPPSVLIRGGFNIGQPPGLPPVFSARRTPARIRLGWESRANRRYLVPNLARSATSDTQHLEYQVRRLWLTYLLEHVDQLPEGLVYHLHLEDVVIVGDDEQDEQRRYKQKYAWLQQYDALTVYRLARQAWSLALRDIDHEGRDALSDWENGEGKPLLLDAHGGELCHMLLDLILPRITTLQIVPPLPPLPPLPSLLSPLSRYILREGAVRYVCPPQAGWQDVLAKWRDFVSIPTRWPVFVDFVNGLEGLLASSFSKHLNVRFRDRLTSFNEVEILSLVHILSSLIQLRLYEKRPFLLSKEKADLLRRLQEVAGDLKIGFSDESWRIDSFTIPTVS